MAVTAKHFPGHGGSGDPHLGAAVDDSTLADLEAADLLPFEALIDDGAEAVMVGHVAYPEIWGDEPASLVPEVYELLRDQGFDGVAITDALGHGSRARSLRLRPSRRPWPSAPAPTPCW